jgi:DNA polymerase
VPDAAAAAERASLLAQLAQESSGCTKCDLSQSRTQVVFGVGNSDAELMFVGEAPGFHEDRQGEPFVGAAGQLLTRLLESIGLTRAQVYIGNVLKCRPPGNRDPLPVEIEACRPYLVEQIRLVDPRIVVTLGNFATKLLLDTTAGISKLRGRRFTYEGRLLVPTFHPAAALRGGGGGRFGIDPVTGLEEDFRLVGQILCELREAPAAQAPAEESPVEEPAQLGLF